MSDVTPEQYGELCDLFEQAMFTGATADDPDFEFSVDEDPDRIHSTSDWARALANAAVRALGLEVEMPDMDEETLRRMADYLNRGNPDSKD